MDSMRIIVATKNEGKIREIKEILKGFEIISQAEAGIDTEAVEDGATFEENAIKKAMHIWNITKTPALADDSGLEVYALGGAPGIYSARYAGENKTDRDRISKLLSDLQGVSDRRARFVCVVALVLGEDRIITARGECEGLIAYESAGENGFGYDSVFFVERCKKTFAQLPEEEKNRISHRAKALSALMKTLSESHLDLGA